MRTVFLLQHMYQYGEHGDHEEIKILGIYDNKEKAQADICNYKKLPGFKNYSDECFYIDEYQLNVGAWKDGFIEHSE